MRKVAKPSRNALFFCPAYFFKYSFDAAVRPSNIDRIAIFLAFLWKTTLACSISALSANRKRLCKIKVNNKIDEEYKFSRYNKEEYPEVVPHNPLCILVVDVRSKAIITPRHRSTSRLKSWMGDHTRIVQTHEAP
jgi:hypothetical protein